MSITTLKSWLDFNLNLKIRDQYLYREREPGAITLHTSQSVTDCAIEAILFGMTYNHHSFEEFFNGIHKMIDNFIILNRPIFLDQMQQQLIIYRLQ